MGTQQQQLKNVPQVKIHTRKRDLTRIVRNKIIPILEDMNDKLNVLFEYPLKFHPKYLSVIDKNKLQILVLAIGWNTDVDKLLESERRRLFKKVLLFMKFRQWTYEEFMMLLTALGFPRKKRSKLKFDVQLEISRLVRRIKKSLIKNTIK